MYIRSEYRCPSRASMLDTLPDLNSTAIVKNIYPEISVFINFIHIYLLNGLSVKATVSLNSL